VYLRELELEEFRSYRRLSLPLDRHGLRLSGPNASGKSSLLEAVAMLATTRSPRSTVEREVVNWSSGAELGFPPFARLRGIVETQRRTVEVEIGLETDPARSGLVRKQIKLNGRAVRAMDAVGTLKAVLFSPEDVALVTGSPAGRRRYLDLTISQIDGAYLRALSRYGRVLAQRNGLLKSLARDRVPARSAVAAEQLGFWDGELVAVGAAIVARRHAVVCTLATLAAARFRQLSPSSTLQLGYLPTFPLDALAADASAATPDGAQAVVAREFEARLDEARPEEFRRGVTLVGPHRDDLRFDVSGVELGAFGSRGQQRLAVVALKLAETVAMNEMAGEPPVLLLDDVLSELDAAHRSLLTGTAADVGAQLIVTATDAGLLDIAELAHLPAARVADGTLTSD
jgi:DNA replication and repair protein RecF